MAGELLSHNEKAAEEPIGLPFGLYLPSDALTNGEIETWNVVTPGGHILTAHGIEQRTGILRRYRTNNAEDSYAMGRKAALMALRHDIDTQPVDAVFVSTSYPTGVNLSETYSRSFGALHPELSLDIYAACSGFTRGLYHLRKHEDQFLGKKILFVSTEHYSPTLEDIENEGISADPSLAQTIFSDGAAATIFRYGDNFNILGRPVKKKLPRELEDAIRMPIRKNLMIGNYITEDVPVSNGKFEQKGLDVYQAVRTYIPQIIREAIDKSGINPKDIKLIIPHQASIHVLEALVKKMPEYSFMFDIEDGNFSSASILKALMKAIHDKQILKGDNIVLAGFGAGLFASVVVVEFH